MRHKSLAPPVHTVSPKMRYRKNPAPSLPHKTSAEEGGRYASWTQPAERTLIRSSSCGESPLSLTCIGRLNPTSRLLDRGPTRLC